VKKISKIVDYFQDIFFIIGGSRKKIIHMSFLFLFVSLLDLVGIGLVGVLVQPSG